MTSGIPEGSVVGPLLLVISIHDLDVNVDGLMSKFAGDIKIGRVADSEEGCQKIKWDIDQL